ncbi:hypothetical protein QEN19_003619 [Hanseniaspora menglaensis]
MNTSKTVNKLVLGGNFSVKNTLVRSYSSEKISFDPNNVDLKTLAEINYKRSLPMLSKEISNKLRDYLITKPAFFDVEEYKNNLHKAERIKRGEVSTILLDEDQGNINNEYVFKDEISMNENIWSSHDIMLTSNFIDLAKYTDTEAYNYKKDINNFFNKRLKMINLANLITDNIRYNSDVEQLLSIFNILMSSYMNRLNHKTINQLDKLVLHQFKMYSDGKDFSLLIKEMVGLATKVAVQGDFIKSGMMVEKILENCYNNRVPSNDPLFFSLILSTIGKTALVNNKVHFFDKNTKTTYKQWMRLNARNMVTSIKHSSMVRINELEDFQFDNAELVNHQIKEMVYQLNWKQLDPENLLGGNIIQYVSLNDPSKLDEFVSSRYLNKNDGDNLKINNNLLNSLVLTYCKNFDVIKAMQLVDTLLGINESKVVDSLSFKDISFKIPYNTIMGYLIDSIILETNSILNNEAVTRNGKDRLKVYNADENLTAKYQFYLEVKRLFVKKWTNLNKTHNNFISDNNNLDAHLKIFLDKQLYFIKFFEYEHELFNMEFIELFNIIVENELNLTVYFESKSVKKINEIYSIILNEILPRLEDANVGLQFINNYYTNILIKHAGSPNQILQYSDEKQRDLSVFQARFEEFKSQRDADRLAEEEREESIIGY